MTTEPVIVRCPACGAKNRVRQDDLRRGAKVVCGRCKTELAASVPHAQAVQVTDRTLAAEVDLSPLPVLIDLWAPWCGPCRTMAPTIEQLASELTGRVKVAKLNVDENPEAAARFRAHSIPTLVLVAKGREIDRLVGLMPKVEIARWLEGAISRVH